VVAKVSADISGHRTGSTSTIPVESDRAEEPSCERAAVLSAGGDQGTGRKSVPHAALKGRISPVSTPAA